MGAEPALGRPDVAKVFGSMLRQLLLFEYGEADMTPSRAAARLGAQLNLVAYHTTVLRDAGFVELVETRRVRGAVEHTYRAVARPHMPDEKWQALPPKVRRALSRLLVGAMARDTRRALDEGGMDGVTTHLSRCFLELDDQGREELAALLARTVDAARAIELTARSRVQATQQVELQLLAFDRPSRP